MRLSSSVFNRGIDVIKKNDLFFLFLFLIVIYNLNFRYLPSGDTLPAALLPFSILDQHTVFFDLFSNYIQTIKNPYMFSIHSGHYLSQYPIVLPVLVTPLYVIPYLFLKIFHIPIDMLNHSFNIICLIMDKIAASSIASLSAVFLYVSLKNLFNKEISLICTLIYAFATNTWAISSQTLWQHGAVELFLVILIYLVVINEKQMNRNNFLLMGFLSGLLIFCRPVDSILLLPILYYVFIHNTSEKFYYISALIFVSLPFCVYNLIFFGNIFGGYSSVISMFIFNLEAINGFLGLMISPNRGLLIFSPVCLLAIFGIFGIKNIKAKKIKNFLFLMVIAILCQIIVYSFFKVWWGGYSYGPRFLTGMLPFFMILIAIFFDDFFKTTWTEDSVKKYLIFAVIVFFICTSLFVQIVGVFYYPNGSWDNAISVDTNNQRLWDWNDSQILYSFRAGPYPITPIVIFSNFLSAIH